MADRVSWVALWERGGEGGGGAWVVREAEGAPPVHVKAGERGRGGGGCTVGRLLLLVFDGYCVSAFERQSSWFIIVFGLRKSILVVEYMPQTTQQLL